MGIGGGTFGVPLMTLFAMPIHRAVATASGFGVLIAVPSVLGFLLVQVADAPPWTVGAVNLPAFAVVIGTTLLTTPWGVRLAPCDEPQAAETRLRGVPDPGGAEHAAQGAVVDGPGWRRIGPDPRIAAWAAAALPAAQAAGGQRRALALRRHLVRRCRPAAERAGWRGGRRGLPLGGAAAGAGCRCTGPSFRWSVPAIRNPRRARKRRRLRFSPAARRGASGRASAGGAAEAPHGERAACLDPRPATERRQRRGLAAGGLGRQPPPDAGRAGRGLGSASSGHLGRGGCDRSLSRPPGPRCSAAAAG
jgi:hypothetical protein